jgi:hypothetical protein
MKEQLKGVLKAKTNKKAEEDKGIYLTIVNSSWYLARIVETWRFLSFLSGDVNPLLFERN